MKNRPDYKTTFQIRSKGIVMMAIAGMLATTMNAAPANNALPSGNTVKSGNVNIATSGNTMSINQASSKSIINWNTYNIGKDATVNYNFANKGSSSLNRVASNNLGEIYGKLNANGQVILINPNGVVFGNGSSVNVSSLVATTMNIKDADYLDGKLIFTRDNNTGKILNEGSLTAEDKGYIALLSPEVVNSGVIKATMGTISLVAGERIELSLDSTGLKTIIVEPSTIQTLIENKSLISADGGNIYLGAKQAGALLDGVMNIKNSGQLEASSMTSVGGRIVLEGHNIENSGILAASSQSSQGGEIRIVADNTIYNFGKINADGVAGGFVAMAGGNIVATNEEGFSVASLDGKEENYGWYYIGHDTAYASAMKNPNLSGSGVPSEYPTLFNENKGQFGDGVAYGAMGQKQAVVLSAADATAYYALNGTTIGIAFNNANSKLVAQGENATKSYSNYYINGVIAERLTDYASVKYANIYDGVDLVYYTNKSGEIEHDLVVNAGADASRVGYSYGGAKVRKLASGDIEIKNGDTTIIQLAPLTYQKTSKGRQVVASEYQTNADETVSIKVKESYDKGKSLVIDPTVSYGTYLGGSGDDRGRSVAVDSSGNAYVAGYTSSTSSVATVGQTVYGGSSYDAFVAKYDSAGTKTWASYMGGSGDDYAYGIAVDSSGNAYLAGYTDSTSTVATVGQTVYGGGTYDAFVAKFSTTGTKTWASYLGGSGNDYAYGIAVDSGGNSYLAGKTNSASDVATAGQTTIGGSSDAFVAKFDTTGVKSWATYVGGAGSDQANAIAIDASGNSYIAGDTKSTAGIATTGQTVHGGSANYDAFVAKIDNTGTKSWGTYLGGSATDQAYGIAVDASGNSFVVGNTRSTSTISTLGQTVYGGSQDSFVVKIDTAGAKSWGTYLGGSGTELASSVAVDTSGAVYVAGFTDSTSGVATTGQTTNAGSDDAFIAKYDGTGTKSWATFMGGSGTDQAHGIALDSSGNAYIAGYSDSTSSVATTGQTVYGGGMWDAFLVHYIEPVAVVSASPSSTSTQVSSAQEASVSSVTTTTVPKSVQKSKIEISAEKIINGILASLDNAYDEEMLRAKSRIDAKIDIVGGGFSIGNLDVQTLEGMK